MHSVVQVIPQEDFTVYVYFADGRIKLYDAKHLLNKGVFKKISIPDDFINLCTVINNTLAWDIGGNYDPYKCIDIDPDTIYQEGRDTDDPVVLPA